MGEYRIVVARRIERDAAHEAEVPVEPEPMMDLLRRELGMVGEELGATLAPSTGVPARLRDRGIERDQIATRIALEL